MEQYTNGNTFVSTQPKTIDTAFVRDYFFPQQDFPKSSGQVLGDSINTSNTYPFPITGSNVTNIEAKLRDVTLVIEADKIISDKPIYVSLTANTLLVWNAEPTQNNIITEQGETFTQGYNITDFNNNNIKSLYQFLNSSWAFNMADLSSIELSGNNNKVVIQQELSKVHKIKSIGKNIINCRNTKFDILDLNTTNSNFEFESATCNILQLHIKGLGNIYGLTVLTQANISLIGPYTIYLSKTETANVVSTVFGTGQVIWK